MPEKNSKKRSYEKPALRKIDLAADEVLVVGCKVPAPTSGFGNPASCILPIRCYGPGS